MTPSRMPYIPASDYAREPDDAAAYVKSRAEDAKQVMDTMLNLPYVAVRINPDGGVLVGTLPCKSVTCAVAYILARWW